MKKKNLIMTGIGVIVVATGILGYSFIHNGTKAVETMAETNITVTTDDSPMETVEKSEPAEEKPPTEEIISTDGTVANNTDIKQEMDIAQENKVEREKNEPDTAEAAQNENIEEIDIYMYTTADLKMRTGSSTDSNVIEVIPYGTQIHVTARTADNWYRAERDEIGYVSGKYLSEEEPPKKEVQQPQTTENTNEQTVGLEKQAQASQEANQSVTNEEFAAQMEVYIQSIGGGTGGRDVPRQEYQGISSGRTDIHAAQ